MVSKGGKTLLSVSSCRENDGCRHLHFKKTNSYPFSYSGCFVCEISGKMPRYMEKCPKDLSESTNSSQIDSKETIL
jgi:hypothetical protein